MQLVHSRSRRSLTTFADNPDHAVLVHGNNTYDANSGLLFLVSEIVKASGIDESSVLGFDGSEMAVSDVRELKTLSAQKFGAGLSRLISISNFDALNRESQNTMLKMVEEPSEGLMFVFSAGDIEDVLGTIRSRVTALRVQPPEHTDIAAAYPGKTTAEINASLSISRGDTKKVMDYLEGNDANLNIAKLILAGDKFERIVQAGLLAKDREKATDIVWYIQNILMFMVERDVEKSGSQLATLTGKVSACQKTIKAINANANVKLALDSLFVGI